MGVDVGTQAAGRPLTAVRVAGIIPPYEEGRSRMTLLVSDAQLPRCGLFRRLAAILYDTLLLLAVLFVATGLVLPLNGGQAVRSHHPLYMTYLLFISFFFFGYFWTHGGQTLGMRAWRIRVQTRGGYPIGWWHAVLRFFVALVSWALLGLGFFWSLFDRQKRTWHDIYSETVLVRVPPIP